MRGLDVLIRIQKVRCKPQVDHANIETDYVSVLQGVLFGTRLAAHLAFRHFRLWNIPHRLPSTVGEPFHIVEKPPALETDVSLCFRQGGSPSQLALFSLGHIRSPLPATTGPGNPVLPRRY